MLGKARQAIAGRDDPRVHAQQAFDHRVTARLLGDLADHRVERILPVLDSAASFRHVSGAVTA